MGLPESGCMSAGLCGAERAAGAGVPEAAWAAGFFGRLSLGIHFKYHAAPAMPASSTRKRRPARRTPGRKLPPGVGFGFRERSTTGFLRLTRISGFGKGFSSDEAAISRSTGGCGAAGEEREAEAAGTCARAAGGFGESSCGAASAAGADAEVGVAAG